MVTRPALDLRPGDQVRQPSGGWFTVATRPKASRTGGSLRWFYEGGCVGVAHWLAELPCRPARPDTTTAGASL